MSDPVPVCAGAGFFIHKLRGPAGTLTSPARKTLYPTASVPLNDPFGICRRRDHLAAVTPGNFVPVP